MQTRAEAVSAILRGEQPERAMDVIPAPIGKPEVDGPTRHGNVFLRYDGITVCVSSTGYALVSPGA